MAASPSPTLPATATSVISKAQLCALAKSRVIAGPAPARGLSAMWAPRSCKVRNPDR